MTDTALLERVVTTTSLTLPAGITAVASNPINFDRDNTYPLFVTRTEHPRTADRIGTVARVIPAPSGNGWLLPDGTGRLFGSVVCPARVNGSTYYVKDMGIMRYNDGDHVGDRHHPLHSWSILRRTDGSEWPVNNDSLDSLSEAAVWFEVTLDVSDVRQGETTPEPAYFTGDSTLAGPLRGCAQPEEDGRILLNPEREFGTTYLRFADGYHPYPALWRDNGEGGEWVNNGQFTNYYGNGVELESIVRFVDERRTQWVKLKTRRRAEQVEDNEALLDLQRQLRVEREEWEAMNEALNDMATDRGHCSDYDDIVTRVGMNPRQRKFDIEVEVDVEFTDDSVSGRLDERLASEYNLSSFDASEITVSGKVRVTFYELEGRDADAAGECIDTSEIEDKLDGDLPSGFSVNDWTIINSSYSS